MPWESERLALQSLVILGTSVTKWSQGSCAGHTSVPSGRIP